MTQYRYLQVKTVDGVVVASFTDAWATTDLAKGQLGSELSAVVAEQACPKILLDCTGLTYASSSMLGKLISLHKEVKAKGGKLTLCALTPTVKEVVGVMKLHELMDIRETVSDGLASFA